jgi:hypothetical protein
MKSIDIPSLYKKNDCQRKRERERERERERDSKFERKRENVQS